MIVKILYTAEEIEKRISQLAKEIDKNDYEEEIVFLCILKGAFCFYADLIRKITIPCTCQFIGLSSYEGETTKSSGNIKTYLESNYKYKDKKVIIIEDIVDTGITINFLKNLLINDKKATEVKVCSLLNKPSRRQEKIDIDYEGFRIDDYFVVGYGLDYDERYRNLPYIGYLENI